MEKSTVGAALGVSDVVIKVTPDAMREKAMQISSAASGIQHKIGELKSVVSGTGSYWNGEAANAYRELFDSLIPRAEVMVETLYNHAANLQQIAELYVTTEKTIQINNSELPGDAIE